MKLKKYYPLFGLTAAVILIQVFVSAIDRQFYLTQLTMSAYYGVVIIGLTILMGYAGQISIGHAAFFAIGGYTTAALTTVNLLKHTDSGIVNLLLKSGLTIAGTDPYGRSIQYISPWLTLFIASLITLVIAYLIGIPILKLKGHYLAMATLGFGIIVYRIALGSSIFGEADGISDVPAFHFLFNLKVSGNPSLRVENYYISWLIVILAIFILTNLINSRVGRALRSLHGNEEAANSMGVNISRKKLMVFILSAVMAAVAGVFMTHFNGGIGPAESGVMRSVRYVSIVAVGGMANLWGTLIMGIILNYLSLRGYFGSYDDAVFGIILILIMLFAPEGIFKLKYYDNIIKFFRKKTAGNQPG